MAANHYLNPQPPLVWYTSFQTTLTLHLVSTSNPQGTLTSSNLELAGSLLHHNATTQNFDIWECTILTKTNNTPTLYWQQKGLATTTATPAYLLQLQAYHQCFHQYLLLHDYIKGTHNKMSNNASCLKNLNDMDFLTHFNSTYAQKQPWQLWTLTPGMLSAVTSMLHRKPSALESF